MAGKSKKKNSSKKKRNITINNTPKNVKGMDLDSDFIEENKDITKQTLVAPIKTDKKNNKKKNNNTVKEKQVKEKEVVEVPAVKEEKVEKVIKKEEKNKKKEHSNLYLEFKEVKKSVKEKKDDLSKKFKALALSIRILIVACTICGLVLIVEALVFTLYHEHALNNVIYHDSYNGVTTDNTGIVMVGNSDFKYSKVNTYTKGNVRGKLVKYNPNGELKFEKVYDKGISTTFNSVISVSDGYIVVGTGIFSKEEKENEGSEAIIIKFNKEGNVVWEKYYSVITSNTFNKVIEVSDGYIAVGQSIYANMEVGNHTTGGGIIVKYSKDGNEMWHNNHGGTKSGNFNDLVVVDGNIYVVGKDGADSANLVKYNWNGEYQWHKNYSYTDSFGFGGISYLDGNLYVVGSKKILPKNTTTKDNRATKDTDAVLIKYNLDGNIEFEKTFGGSSFERYNSILMYHNNFYVVGHICSHDAGLKVTTDKEEEMTGLIVRYDKNGNILKRETFGGSNNDNLTDIATDGFSYYVVGYSNSKDGNLKTSQNNGRNYFGKLIKLNSRFKEIFVK